MLSKCNVLLKIFYGKFGDFKRLPASLPHLRYLTLSYHIKIMFKCLLCASHSIYMKVWGRRNLLTFKTGNSTALEVHIWNKLKIEMYTCPHLFFIRKYNVAFGGKVVFFSLKAFKRSHLFQSSFKLLVQNALGLYSTKE